MPFKANQDRRHHIPKQRHRVTNWAAYDTALRRRGSLTVWFTEAAIAAWKAEPRGTRGGQPRYSALAITTALTLRAVFRLALRQTEGLIASLLRLLDLDLASPDHSTTSAPWRGWVFEGSGDLPRCSRRWWLGNRRSGGSRPVSIGSRSIGVSLQPAIPRRVAPRQSPLPLHQSPAIIAQFQSSEPITFAAQLHCGDAGKLALLGLPPTGGCHLYFASPVTFLYCADRCAAIPAGRLDLNQ